MTKLCVPIVTHRWQRRSVTGCIAWLCELLACCALVYCGGCSSQPPSKAPAGQVLQSATPAQRIDEIVLDDVTAGSGVSFIYRNGEESDECSILESLGGGAGLCDFDKDGRLDVFFPGGGRLGPDERIEGLPPGLFRNLGDWRFSDVSEAAGLRESTPFYSHGGAIADYDNDGFPDMLVTGYGGLQLWHNQGDGTLLEVSRASGIDDDSWSSSAGWGDLNGDGNLDLYVAHYVNWSFKNHPHCPGPQEGQREICPPRVFDPLPHLVLLSSGDGTFHDASEEVGLRTDGKGLGVVMSDLDLDGDLDIYVGNDTTDNFLYVNDGRGKLEEVGVLRGVARDDLGVANGSMGVDVCDFNRDGLPDLWVANYERESFGLYRNEGQGHFLHVSQSTGIIALGGMYVGFGTAFTDIDGDGDEDVLIANGHVIKYPQSAPIKQKPLLLVNENGRFRKAVLEPGGYFDQDHTGRGLAIGDLDGDNSPDAVFAHTNEPAALIRNRTKNGNRHFRLTLIGRQANRDAIGASVVLHTTAGDLLRQVKGGGSYLSQNELTLHWGLIAGCEIESATVHWPSGQQQEVVANEISGEAAILLEPLPSLLY